MQEAQSGVVDIDLKSFFDTIDHSLLIRAVEQHVEESWARLYIRRWLECPVRKQTGEIVARDRGTPQGGVISPLLANLFLHYAFDRWVQTEYPEVPFERYADDVVCHCRTKQQAEEFLSALRERLTACGLSLHPEKTRLVYCKDGRRREEHLYSQFDFLGFNFRARTMQDREGKLFTGFGPAVSQKALKDIKGAKDDYGIASRLEANITGGYSESGQTYQVPVKISLVKE